MKPFAGFSLAFLPGAGVAYFLVGSALGFFAMLHAFESEVGGQWAPAVHWIALSSSVSAHHLLIAMSLLFMATKVWRLGRSNNPAAGGKWCRYFCRPTASSLSRRR